MARFEAAASTEVQEGLLYLAKIGHRSLLLTRVGGKAQAFENRCPHFGLSLARGKVADGVIRCPWHGSRFDICSGRNIDWVNAVAGVPLPQWGRSLVAMGKEPESLTVYPVNEEEGVVYVELP